MTVPNVPERPPRIDARIDVHSHFLPDDWRRHVEQHRRDGRPRPRIAWSPELHVEFMDAWGITAAVVSVSNPAASLGDEKEQRAVARSLNERSSEILRDYGRRMGFLAAVPMAAPSAAVDEIRYALDELRLDGVGLLTSYAGRYLGDPSFERVHAELDSRHAVVFVHPGTSPSWTEHPGLPVQEYVLEYTFETTRAITSLIYSGTARRFPNIRWIFAHGGGTMPFLAFRLGALHAYDGSLGRAVPEGPHTYLSNFYFDTALAFSRIQLAALRSLSDADHLLFATDWPYCAGLYRDDAGEKVRSLADQLPRHGDPAPALGEVFSPDERSRIEGGNAAKLFPNLASRAAGR